MRDHVEDRADAGVVPEIAEVPELDALIEEEIGLADRSLYPEVRGEIEKRSMPEGVLGVRAEPQAEGEIKDGIGGAQERLGLGVERAVFDEAGEGDPAAEHVPLEGHERKGFGVGMHDERAGIDLHAAGEGKMDDRRHAGLQGCVGCKQIVALGPKAGEVALPGSHHLRRGKADPGERHAVGALPERTKAGEWGKGQAVAGVDRNGVRRKGGTIQVSDGRTPLLTIRRHGSGCCRRNGIKDRQDRVQARETQYREEPGRSADGVQVDIEFAQTDEEDGQQLEAGAIQPLNGRKVNR